MADWLVRVYNKENQIIRTLNIKDRTEHEVENEVVSEVKDAFDWTLTEIKKENSLWQ